MTEQNITIHSDSGLDSKDTIFERTDFVLPDKVYKYLGIDPENHSDFEEIILDFISSKHSSGTKISYASDISILKKYISFISKHDISEAEDIISIFGSYTGTIDNIYLLDVKHNHAKAFVLFMENNLGMQASIVKKRITVLKQLYDHIKNYVEQQVTDTSRVQILKNPFLLIKGPKVQASVLKTDALTEKEINNLIGVISPLSNDDMHIQIAERDKLMIIFHIHTGIRVSELLRANLQRFDSYKDGYVKYNYTAKGGEIKSSIIDLRLYDKVKTYCDRYGIGKTDYIFHSISNRSVLNRKDRPLSPVHYGRLLKTYGKLAGIKKNLKTHVCRATTITMLHQEGLNIQEIKDFVGHKDINQTSHYIKAHMESKVKGSKTMNKVMDY